MEDFDLIQFGPYKGQQLISVPAEYLLNLHKKGNLDKDLQDYINDNLNVLELEIQRGKMLDGNDDLIVNHY